MKLTRFKKNSTTVFGVLKDDVGGTYFTIENANCAIPAGVYAVKVCYSPRFQKALPLLTSDAVDASRGIRIHSGNTYKDSQGCVLVGNASDLAANKITGSKDALAQLLRNCGTTLTISEM